MQRIAVGAKDTEPATATKRAGGLPTDRRKRYGDGGGGSETTRIAESTCLPLHGPNI